MTVPPMKNDPLSRERISELLAQRRNYRREIQDLIKQYPCVVFYGCGAILNSIVDTWNEYIGRKIDFCCDSDEKKWGKYYCGAKCISPEELIAMKNECAVFVTIGDFYPVFKYLSERGCPCVNLIYKYDIVASEYLAHCDHGEIVDNLCKVRALLSDGQSKKVFDAIVGRILGGGKDASIMADVCEKNQYFWNDIIGLSDRECFVDIGAFDGDTIKDFVSRTHARFERIDAFEVDAINFGSLKANVGHIPEKDRIRLFNLGVWDSECDITYSIGSSQSTVGSGEGKGHVVPLDTALPGEKVTFVKMDIEGAELRALRGAGRIIRTQKPRLAICVYHDFKHLWEIPLYIKTLVPEYKIYLRHHTNLEYETVCYAVL